MPNYMPCPFLEGQENDEVEVLYLYSKKFLGLNIKEVYPVINYYKKTKSEKLKNILIELVGEQMFNLIVKEYIEDINPETGKINLYSTLLDNKIAIQLKKALEAIIENKERIKEAMASN